MKLKMLLLVGAIAPALAICQPAFAAERQSDIVVAQQQPSANANKKAQEDKKKKGDKKAEAKDKRKQQSKHDQKPAAKQKEAKPQQKQDHKSGQANKGGQRSAQQQKGNKPAAARKDSRKHQDERNQGLKANAQQQQEKVDQKQDHNKAGEAKKGGKQSTQQQKANKPAAANKDGGKRKDEPKQNQKANAQQQQEKAEQKQDNNKPDNNKGGQPTAQQQKSQPAADKKGGQHRDNKQASKDRRLDKVRSERKETHEGNRTVIREQNRTIIRENGRVFIRHDDSDRFEHGARNVREERRGNERVIVIERPGGTQIINVWDADGRLLRRSRRDHGGREVVLFDNHPRGPRNDFDFIVQLPPPIVHIPRDRYIVDADRADRVLIYDTLIAPPVMQIARPYTLDEVRYSYTLRERMPRIDLDTINFETGSWDVTPGEARRLAPIGEAMRRAIQRNPDEIFLIEGHTDAVGSPVDNLSLSDRRAEAVAEVLTDEFGIPPENLVTQGYGEQHLKVLTPGPDRRNRRVTVRRITPLLRGRG
jgi:outer membrane protein OmpA-like peptidoglycan-associated protein